MKKIFSQESKDSSEEVKDAYEDVNGGSFLGGKNLIETPTGNNIINILKKINIFNDKMLDKLKSK